MPVAIVLPCKVVIFVVLFVIRPATFELFASDVAISPNVSKAEGAEPTT